MNTGTSHIGNLDKVMAHNTTRYNGCMIYFNRGKFVFNNKPYDTIQEAKQAVDNSLNNLRNCLIRSGAIK